MANYQVFGPIDMSLTGRFINKDSRIEFWKSEDAKGLVDRKGCYIFGLRHYNKIKPWYVGKATKGFAKECMTDHKLNKYHEVLHDHSGAPVFFFLAEERTKGPTNSKAIGALEKKLIADAFQINSEIMNVIGVKPLPYQISGIGKVGKRPKPLNEYLKMMDLS